LQTYIKTKTESKKQLRSYISRIDSYAKDVLPNSLDQYDIKYDDNYLITYKIPGTNLSVLYDARGKLQLFNNEKEIDLLNLSNLFSTNISELSNNLNQNNKPENNKLSIIYQLIKFIESVSNLNFKSDKYSVLIQFSDIDKNFLRSLLNIASSSLFVAKRYTYDNPIGNLNFGANTSYRIDNYYGNIKQLKVIDKEIYQTLNKLALAYAHTKNTISLRTTKDSLGNQISTNKPVTIASSILRMFSNVNSDSVYFSLLMNPLINNNLIKDYGVQRDISYNGEIKKITDLTIPELATKELLFDFINNINDNKIAIQPCVYSDKPAIYSFIIDLQALNNYEESKTDPKKYWLNLFNSSILGYYEKIKNNILSDFNNLLEYKNLQKLNSYTALNKFLNTFTNEYELFKLVEEYNNNHTDKLEFIENIHYVKHKDKLYVNPFIELNTNKNYIEYRFEQGLNATINYISNNIHIFKYNNYGIKQPYISKLNSRYGKLFSEEWFNGNELIIKKNNEINPLILEYYFSTTVLNENFRLILSGTEHAHGIKNNSIVNFGNQKTTLKNLDFTSYNGTTIKDFNNNEYKLTEKEFYNLVWKWEAAAQLAESKRNSSITTTLQKYEVDTKFGVPKIVDIAYFDERLGNVWQFSGKQEGIKTLDGSNFVTMFTSILENNSLTDSQVGIIKKPYEQTFSNRYGVVTHNKCASFPITAELLRYSINSDFNLYHLLEKMTNRNIDDIDLSVSDTMLPKKLNNEKYESIILSDISNGKNIYLSRANKNYRLSKIAVNYNNNLNKFRLELIDQDTNDTIEVFYNVHSIFDLYEMFGGAYAKELINDKLEYSDIASYFVVNYMNIVSELKNRFIYKACPASAIKSGITNINSAERWTNDESLLTTKFDYSWSGIILDKTHEADAAEMREFSQTMAAASTNGWTYNNARQIFLSLGQIVRSGLKSEFDILEKIVLDKNNIYEINKLYELVGKIIVDSFSNSSISNISLASEILSKIKKEFKIIDADKETLINKIPFSDANIYKAALPGFINFYNKKSIRRSHSGIISVLHPSYGIMQHYNIDGIDYSADEILNKIQKEHPELLSNYSFITKAEYDEEIKNKTFSREAYINSNNNVEIAIKKYLRMKLNEANDQTFDNLMPGMNVAIQNPNDSTYIHIKLDNIEKYIALKYKKNLDLYFPNDWEIIAAANTFKRDCTLGEDLKPQEISWRVNGKKYNIFDLDIVRDRIFNNSIPLNYDKILQIYLEYLNKGIMLVEDPAGKIKLFGKTYITLPITDFTNNAAEMILPNIYAYLFGDADSINDVIAQKELFFKNKIENNFNRESITNWEYKFLKNTGKHVYVVSSDINRETREITPYNIIDDLKVYEKNNNNIKSVLLGEYKENLNITKTNDIYILDGKEVTNIIERTENGITTYYEYIPYFKKLVNLITDEVIYVRNKNTTIEALASIYNSDEFSNIAYNKNSIKEYKEFLNNINNKNKFISQKINALNNYSNIEELNDELSKINESIIENEAKNIYRSFKKSLEFVSARIPGQSFQSFMKMKIKNFAKGNYNYCFVSHWQLYLQGSDFDIDTSNIMGHEFTDNGTFAGWSGLFNYQELPLELLETLPIPLNQQLSIDDEHYTISNDDINTLTNILSGDIKLTNIVNAIKFLDTKYINGKLSIPSNIHPKIIEIVNFINTNHNNYNIPENIRVKAYKNAALSNLKYIIQHPQNILSSYSPVEVSSFDEAAENSELGKETSEQNLYNPISKFNIQYQMNGGKKGVGVCANGIKDLVNLQQYFNEFIRSLNDEERKYYYVETTFNRIQRDKNNKLMSVVKPLIGNVNYKGSSNTNNLNFIKNIIHNYILQEYSEEKGYSREEAESLFQLKFYHQNDISLILSTLLSLATDNAKEMKLVSLNANPEMINNYLYLFIMGFNINDVCRFMTSKGVQTVANLLSSNLFINKNYSFYEITTMLLNNTLKLDKFMEIYSAEIINDIGEELPHQSFPDIVLKIVANNNTLLSKIKNLGNILSDNYASGFEELLKDNAFAKEFIEALKKYDYSLLYNTKYTKKVDIINFQNWATAFIEFKTNYISLSEEDLKDIRELNDIHNNVSSLQSLAAYLAFNQGIPNTTVDKLSFLNNMENILIYQERNLDKNKFINKYSGKLGTTAELSDYYDLSIKHAKELKIDGRNFSYYKFLLNDEFIIDNGVKITYQQATIDYFNLMKSTVNIFHLMTKLPQYTAINDIYKFVETVQREFIFKYKMLLYFRDMRKKIAPLDEHDIIKLETYVDKLIIKEFLDTKDIDIKVPDSDIFDETGTYNTNADTYTNIKLNNEQNIAVFKEWFETTFIKDLKIKFPDNKFIQDLYRDSNIIDNIKETWITVPTDFSAIDLSSTDMENYEKYQQEFNKLTNIKYEDGTWYNGLIENLTYADMFMLYNLIVFRNQYGSDRFTILFKNILNNNSNTLVNSYLEFVGNLDSKVKDSGYDVINFDVTKFKVATAPRVSSKDSKKYDFSERYNKDLKRWLVYKNNNIYLYNFDTITENKLLEFIDKFNILTPYIKETISLTNTDLIINTLKLLMENGKITIENDCK
jgi:hypothetical protein